MSFIVQIGVSAFAGAAILAGTAPTLFSGCAGFFCITPFTLMYFGTEPTGGAIGIAGAGAATGGDVRVGACVATGCIGWNGIGWDAGGALACATGAAPEGVPYAGFSCITPLILMNLGTAAPEALGGSAEGGGGGPGGGGVDAYSKRPIILLCRASDCSGRPTHRHGPHPNTLSRRRVTRERGSNEES